MPCAHKFKENLTLDTITYLPEILIVGTFNPEWPENNYAEWFYGRTDNNYFWDLLPKMFELEGLRKTTYADWKSFCKLKSIALTDLLTSIEDAEINSPQHVESLGTYSDASIAAKFKEFIPTDIIRILKKRPSIKEVYLTTTIGSGIWQDMWSIVNDYCVENDIWCKQLMTPSKGARFFMSKGSNITMPEFIYNDWQSKWKQNIKIQPENN